MAYPFAFFIVFEENGIGKTFVIDVNAFGYSRSDCVSTLSQTSAYTDGAYYFISRASSDNSNCYTAADLIGGQLFSFRARIVGGSVIDCSSLVIDALFFNSSTGCSGPSASNLFGSCILTSGNAVCSSGPLQPMHAATAEYSIATYTYTDNNSSKQFVVVGSNSTNDCATSPVLDVFDTTASLSYIFNYAASPLSGCYINLLSNTSIRPTLDCATGIGNMDFYYSGLDCTGDIKSTAMPGCGVVVKDDIKNPTVNRGFCVGSSSSNTSDGPSTGTIIGIAIGSAVFLSLFIWALRVFFLRRR